MLKSKWNIVLALVACVLFLPATLSAKNQVTRPLKVKSDAIVFIVPSSDSPLGFKWEVTETGEATHLGRFSSLGTGTADYDEDGILYVHYFTDWTAANGDVLHLEGAVYGKGQGFTMKFWIIGGSGRFVGATGSIGDGIEVYYADIDPITGAATWSYRVEGTITY
jgi:hypothetical protein